MNLLEIHSLLEEIFRCPLAEPSSVEDIFISISQPYDHERWKLFIKKSLIGDTLNCIKSIVEENELKINDTLKQGYYVIYSK